MTTTTTAPPITPPAARLIQLGGRYDGPSDLDGELRLASMLAGARITVPPQYRGSPGDVLAVMYAAKGLDIAISTALQQLFFQTGGDGPDTGKGGMSGALMLALIIRAGHQVVVTEHTETAVAMTLVRCDNQPGGDARWTIIEAARAGIADRESWIAYPGDMLYWRCLARLARQFAADVVQGFGYTPEEVALTVPDITAAVSPGREPAPDVMALLKDLDTLDHDEARALWRKARSAGLLDQYAGQLEGRPVTVQAVIAEAVERRRLAAQATTDAAAAAPGAPAPDLPGVGYLACGCEQEAVALTGDHLLGCTLAVAPPAPAEPEPATVVVVDEVAPVADPAGPVDADPVDVLAQADEDLDCEDVLEPLNPCGCHPLAIQIAGHGPRCTAGLAGTGAVDMGA